MSFFFGTDIWDEMNRMQKQLEDIASHMDYNHQMIEGSKKGAQKDKAVCPFSTKAMNCSFNPVTDLAENDDSYIVSMDLPGVKKDELNVSVHNGVLTVSGTRRHKFESSDEDEEKKGEEKKDEKKEEKNEEKREEEKKEEKNEEKKEEVKKEENKPVEDASESEKKPKQQHKVIRMESYYGSFQRSISVPVGTTSDDVKAKFDNGVLTITIAKHVKQPVKKIEIQ